MSNIITILKYNLLQFFNKLTKNLTKKKKRSNLALGLITGGLALFFYGLIIFYILIFTVIFKEAGKPEGVLVLVTSVFSMLCFMTTLTKANSVLFRMKDYDLLSSLLIERRDILISKLLSIIGSNPVISILIGIPTIIIYGLFNTINGSFYVCSFIGFIFVPIVPIILGCFISYILGFIPIKQRVKNLLSTLLYAAFLIVIMTFSMTMSEDTTEMNNQLESMIDTLEKVNFLSPIAISGMLGNVGSLLLYIGISVISLVVFIVLVTIGFNKIIVNINYRGKTSKYKFNEKDYNTLSPTKALLKKEFTLYMSMPSYIMNTIVGAIMSIIITVVMGLNLGEVVTSVEMEGLEGLDFYVIIYLVIYLFTFGLTNTATASISLEGKNFWILKSLPIDYKPVFKAKVLLNVIVNIPFLIIDFVLLCIFAPFSPLYAVVIILSTFIYVLSNTIFGLYLNIKKYDFNCEPIKAIKQNMPVMIMCLITFVYMFVGAVVYFLTYGLFGMIGLLIVSVLFNVIYFLIAYLLLTTNGVKAYNNID